MLSSSSPLPEDRLESRFQDFKAGLSDIEAITEANRCINCYAAPCIQACPTEINIPRFISRIANQNTRGAAETILDSNILGLSCARSCPTEVLCEGACVYNSLDKKPILIGKLQRFATERAYAKGEVFYHPGKETGKTIALIGAGPASLACAHELRKYGHKTVIFEKSPLPGGLNTQGIAPYKMKADTSLREIEEITRMGVQFEYGRELGRNLSLQDLLKKYDRLFLGMGLGPDSRLDIPGLKLPHVWGAVELIAGIKLGAAQSAGENAARAIRDIRTALVIGGGNTALDACRELKALGVPRVVVSYRKGEADMSGYTHEFKWARQEGVEFFFHSLPQKIEPGKVTLMQNNPARDSSANEPPSEILLDCELVVMATGQAKFDIARLGVSELRFEGGRLQVDAQGRTGHPKIYGGGDLTNGGKEVVNAVAEGKRAAIAIHHDLMPQDQASGHLGGFTHG